MQVANPIFVPVSVVIPCYCCSGTIERALNSVAEQTCLPHEVILVDDGSPDGGATLTCLRRLKERHQNISIRILASQENKGAATARNQGWNAATQPYIAFLDADDTWHPQKLEYHYRYMQEHPDVALSGHGHILCKEVIPDDLIFSSSIRAVRLSSCSLLLSNPFVTPSVMIKTNIPFRFRGGQRHMEDHLLWLEIILAGYPVVKLDIPLTFIYKASYGVSGLSSHMWRMEKAELGNYWLLCQEGRIGWMAVFFLLPYSLAKYMRRLLIVGARRMRFVR